MSDDLLSLIEYPLKAERVMFSVPLPPEDTDVVCSDDVYPSERAHTVQLPALRFSV